VTTRRDTAVRGIALACIGAGSIHLALGPAHMSEWAPLGVGFVLSGVVQVLLGLVLLRWSARLPLAAVAVLTSGLAAVWLVSRTTGLPVGPGAFSPDPVGRADLICVGLESVVALGALILLRRPAVGLTPTGRRTTWLSVLAATAIVGSSTGVAVAAPHGHEHAPCPSTPVPSGVDANGNGADDGVERYFTCVLHESHVVH
jgi:hypothetical protein